MYNYGKLLGSRVGHYLAKFDTDASLGKFIIEQYKERHQLSHGFWHFSPDIKYAGERIVKFGKLHEIVRLCLLGFLSLDTNTLSFMSLNGGKLQKELDELPPADGVFLKEQHMWLE